MINLDFKKMKGLVPAVIQDYKTNEVLMVGFMNKESWEKTLETKKACFFSRSRGKLWLKGETSGNFQLVKEILVDCDGDAVVIKVEQLGGAACHVGYNSCFYRKVKDKKLSVFKKEKIFDPEEVYGK